jgi:dCTP deaminase
LILTGEEIAAEVGRGRIHIDDFDHNRVEPNSYGFRLGATIMEYEDEVLDTRMPMRTHTYSIPDEGLVLHPDRLYLGATKERMGSDFYAATLYARLSVSTLGIWIQYSAPLGHCGAVIPWTLEIKAAQPVRVYQDMPIGKIAFWEVYGEPVRYTGRYTGSDDVVASRFALDQTPLTIGVPS